MLGLVLLAAAQRPSNPTNVTVYAIRPLALVDITDKDSADAAGDLFFWIKDHVIKPMHCRVEPTWHLCNDTKTIDHDMVYQTFTVEYDSSAVEPYASCNPDENATDPSAHWICSCHGFKHDACKGFGEEEITHQGHHQQFPGDPTPLMSQKLSPGKWFSTIHNTECGSPRADPTLPCTWKKYPGKIVTADCLEANIVSVVTAAAGGAVQACEQAQGSVCNYTHASATNLSDCCINAFVGGVNATSRENLVAPFEQAFTSADPTKGGCAVVPPPTRALPKGFRIAR